MASKVCQNYHPECQAAVNQLANLELHASYVYLSMVCYFERDNVALGHTAAFLNKESLKKRRCAEDLLSYQNKRGGHIILQDIEKPDQEEWQNILRAFHGAQQLEEKVNQALLDLYRLAAEKKDFHLCHFLKSRFLREEVETIKQLGDHVSNLQLLGVPQDGMGEHLFDKLTLRAAELQGFLYVD